MKQTPAVVLKESRKVLKERQSSLRQRFPQVPVKETSGLREAKKAAEEFFEFLVSSGREAQTFDFVISSGETLPIAIKTFTSSAVTKEHLVTTAGNLPISNIYLTEQNEFSAILVNIREPNWIIYMFIRF